MKKNILLVAFTFVCIFWGCISAQAQVISYKLVLLPDGVTYEVYMKSDQTFTGGNANVTSAQVSIVAPTGFDGVDAANIPITNASSSMIWAVTRVNTPTQNPTKDYLFFGFNGAYNFGGTITAGQEYKLFSFQNTGASCPGALSLVNNFTDPFVGDPNINVANSMTVLGLQDPNGGPAEAYLENFVEIAPCPGSTTCNASAATLSK